MSAFDAEGHRLLGRTRLAPGGRGRSLHLILDGWPLLLVRLDVGLIAVNDLRNRAMYSHVAAVGSIGDDQELRLGAVGNELYLLVGEVATVFVTPEDGRSGHAEVAVVASATGRLLLERTVRYRQVSLPGDSCGMANGGRRALAPQAPPTTPEGAVR